MPEQLIDRLADQAGEILRRWFRASAPAERKADFSPVTQADREVEQALRAMIEAEFPEDGIIGEEYGTVRPEAHRQWVLDPIDGTRSFMAGYPIFTTLIGMAIDGVPSLGVIDQPLTQERWVGQSGQVSRLNGAPIHCRDCPSLAQAVMATTSMEYFTPEQQEVYVALRSACAHSVLGGDAYAYAMLASGQLDIVIDAGMKPYDFCAVVPVVEGAGGVITDWLGNPLTIHSEGDVLASASPALHIQLLEALYGG